MTNLHEKYPVEKKRLSWVIYALCIFLSLLILIFAISPVILSTKTGTNLVAKHLSKKTSSTIYIEQMSLAWFSPQYIKGLEYKDKSGNQYSIEKISITSSLWDLFITHSPKGKTVLFSPHCHFHSAYFSQTEKQSKLSSALMGLTKNLEIENLDITLLHPTYNTINLNKTNFQLNFEKDDFINLSTKGFSKMTAYAGQFDITMQLSIKEFKNKLKKSLSFNELINTFNLKLKSKTTNFPTLPFDYFIAAKYPHLEGLLASTVGSILNSDIDLEFSPQTIKSSIDVLSNYVKLSMSTHSTPHGITLDKPSFFSYNLNPSFYQKIASLYHFSEGLTLASEGFLQFSLENIFIPKIGNFYDVEKAAFSGRFASSSLAFHLNKINDRINFNSFNINVASKNLSNTLELSGQSSINYGEKNPSLINFSCHLNRLFSDEFLSNNKAFSHVKFDISKFPVIFLDRLFNQNGKLLAFIGDNFSFKTSSQTDATKVRYLSSFLSPRLHIPNISFAMDRSLYLEKPAGFIYLPNQEEFFSIFNNDIIKLTQLGNIKGQLEAFGISLQNISLGLFDKIEMQILVNLDKVNLSDNANTMNFSLTNTRTNINVNTTKRINLDLTSTFNFIDSPLNEMIFGKNIKMSLNALANIKPLNNRTISSLKGFVESDRLRINIDSAIEDNLKKMVFLSPIQSKIQLAPELFNSLLSRGNNLISYMPYVSLEITIDPQPIYLDEKLFRTLAFQAKFSLTKLDIVNKIWYELFSLENTEGYIEADASKKTLTFDLKTHAQSNQTSAGILTCHLSTDEFTSLEFYKKNYKGKIDFEDFSAGLTDYVLGYTNFLIPLIGNSYDLKLTFDKNPSELEANLDIESSKFYFKSDLIFSDVVRLKKSPIKLSWQITNDTLLSLQKFFSQETLEQYIKLTSPTTIHGKISSLSWPLHIHADHKSHLDVKKWLNHINLSTVDMDISMDDADLESTLDKHKIHLNDFSLKLAKDSDQSPFTINIKSFIEESLQESSSDKGSFIANGVLDIRKENPETINTQMKASFVNFPTLILDSFVKTFGMAQFNPSIFLGKRINAALDTKLENLSGMFDFDVNSNETQLNINAYLNEGIVKLYKPIQGSLKITPNLADHLLKTMNINLVHAGNPLRLHISDKGFYMPIQPFNLENLYIRDGLLDIGKITCSNAGSPNDVEGIFKLNTSKKKNIDLWFAPTEFSISNGFLNVDRTEILFNKAYQIAVWGRVNLIKQYVNMILGLTAQSLNEAFGLRGLPKNFVLQIPMTGPIGDVHINKELAATRVALLLAKTSGVTKNAGAFGSIFDVLGEFANDQSSVPAPKKPFPWDRTINQLIEEHRKERDLHIIK